MSSADGTSRSSGIPMPSKALSPSKALGDLSESKTNSRTQSQSAGIPTLKRKLAQPIDYSEPKRKTLAERAGEPRNQAMAAAPTSRPIAPAVENVTRMGVRNTYSASVSTKPTYSTARSGSANPFSASVNVNSRPGTGKYRTQSVVGHSKQSLARNGRPVSTQGQSHPPVVNGSHDFDISEFSRIGDKFDKFVHTIQQTWDQDEKKRRGDHEALELYGARIRELEIQNAQLTASKDVLTTEFEIMQNRLTSANVAYDEQVRKYDTDMRDLQRQLSDSVRTMDDAAKSWDLEQARLKQEFKDELASTERIAEEKRQHEQMLSCESLEASKRTAAADLEAERERMRRDVDNLRQRNEEELKKVSRERDEHATLLEQRFRSNAEEEQGKVQKELESMKLDHRLQVDKLERDISGKDREVHQLQMDLEKMKLSLDFEKELVSKHQATIAENNATIISLESQVRHVKAHVDFLEADGQSQSRKFTELDEQLQDAVNAMNDAKAKLLKEETLRRKLHNQVQELKGNIRVFCRVRPRFADEPEEAQIAFPDEEVDSKEIVVRGREHILSQGKSLVDTHNFSFDHVFGPKATNENVFEEISQLVQSALDGYNVCIFCYGQTGSGKTHTMGSSDGMIARATKQIYDTAKELEEKGWSYSIAGNFVEVYNESINDLLGNPEDLDKKKHEIRHDTVALKTTITDVETVPLDAPEAVEQILSRASKNRRVAATKANERSSRSHSVFILHLTGFNRQTGEKSEGTLNLVDLAGSERLSHSGATGDRLKETQKINQSLSSLGTVIGALASKKPGSHIPYRDSKLTHLLQYSLGGNSKTLMFVMVSPLQDHLQETVTSLKFATKVSNTFIGTAKKQSKVKN